MLVISDEKITLRPPEVVMRLNRIGSFHQTRLSFMRTLLREMNNNNWQFPKPDWNIDDNGVGEAIYYVKTPHQCYSLVCFSHDLDPNLRSDRVIATAWDATFVLFDGIPDEKDMKRLKANVPKQEAGRLSEKEICLSRANRSGRLFSHVVERLSSGEQPDSNLIEKTGYLMRTTAVYGSGKFGALDNERIAARHEMSAPFRAEMLSVWLIRAFSVDIVEHLAEARRGARGGERSVKLSGEIRQKLGIGNSTGLGMAPFIINHPILFHHWIFARETALARIRAIQYTEQADVDHFNDIFDNASRSIAQWNTNDETLANRIAELSIDLTQFSEFVQSFDFSSFQPWNALYNWATNNLHTEAQEFIISLFLEPYGHLTDDLASKMRTDEGKYFIIDASMDIAHLKALIVKHFNWAIKINYNDEPNQARFWYVSAEKLEPRLGLRHQEPGQELELAIDYGYEVKKLYRDLKSLNGLATQSIADFLLDYPQHRHTIRRIQLIDKYNYALIRDNLIDINLHAVDLLRCKLSFFGATRFDPRSDKWIRICMYQNAPYPDNLHRSNCDNWIYPQQ